jgi:hypothetical protein
MHANSVRVFANLPSQLKSKYAHIQYNVNAVINYTVYYIM